MRLTDNALKVLNARYLWRDSSGQLMETPEELFRRVTHAIAQAENCFNSGWPSQHWEEAFFQLLSELDFLPNSPTLMNAGTPCGHGHSLWPIERLLRPAGGLPHAGGIRRG